MKLNHLTVNEVFGPTFQGEGRYAGRACAFLRLAYCNLSCIWCDTPFTWNWTGTDFIHPDKYDKDKETHDMTNAEIVARISKFDVGHLVISGGEPLLQQTRLIPFLRMLKASGPYFVEVETNGTIMPTKEFLPWVDQINCSPKLSNSGDATHLRIKPKVLQFLTHCNKVDFKFVIGPRQEIDEVEGFRALFGISKERVWLMPLGKTKDELKANSFIEYIAKAQGFNFSPRLQIETYGDKRGV